MRDSDRLKNELTAQYPCRVELHLHTKPASDCAQVPTEEALTLFAQSGYSAVCFTNHLMTGYVKKRGGPQGYMDFIMAEYENACKIGEALGMRVYLCCEIRFENEAFNDFLLYGLDSELLWKAINSVDGTVAEYVHNVKDKRTFLTQAHPFRNGMYRENPELLDGIEAYNLHPNHNNRTLYAVKWADEEKKNITIGTDYHDPGNHNLCATRFRDLPEDSFDVARRLFEKNYIMEIGSTLILP